MDKQNLIDGQWLAGARMTPDVNPSNTADIVGEFAQADRAQADAAIAARGARLPSGLRRACSSAPMSSTRSAPRSSPARTSSAAAVARGRQDAGRGHRRGRARRADLQVLRRRGAARCRRDACPRCAPASTSRSPASRSASSASSRRGTSRSRSRPGRSRRRSPTATPWCSSRPTSCPAAPGRSPTSCTAPACRKGVFNLVMGRGSVVGQAHRRSAPTSTPSASPARYATGAPSPQALDRAHAQVPARDGRQEPAGGARRRRSRRGGRACAATAPSSRPASAARPRRRLIVTEGIHDRFVEAHDRAHGDARRSTTR